MLLTYQINDKYERDGHHANVDAQQESEKMGVN